MSERRSYSARQQTSTDEIASAERNRRIEAEIGSRNLLNALLRMVDGARRVA